MASMNGVKSMRAAGASPEMLQQAKRGLTAAFGTYAANAASASGKGLAGWGAGRLGREGYEAASEFSKTSKSRWAEEMARLVRAAQKAHEAGNAQQARALIEQAQHIGETVGKAGTKLREVMPLSTGAEASAKLMAGDVVHQRGAGGMAAVKFLDPARGVRVEDIVDTPRGRDAALKKFHDYNLPQRELESTLDPNLMAKSHGMFRRAGASSGDVDAMRSGGVELQEFLPFRADRPQTDAVGKAFDDSAYYAAAKKQYIDRSGRPFVLRDINDRFGNFGNVRLDVSGKPKALDLIFGPFRSGRSVGNISREEGHEGAHASKVLRELREGTAKRVERLAPPESLGDKIKRILAAEPKSTPETISAPPPTSVPSLHPAVEVPKPEPLPRLDVPKQPVLSTEVPKPSKPSHALRNAVIAAGIGVPVVAGGAALAHHIYKKNKQEDGMPKAAGVNVLALLEKIAKTRAQKEAIKALEHGDSVTADTIAKGYGDLGLKPRALKDVHRGGQEAAVDLMMGAAGGQGSGAGYSGGKNMSNGYVIRKMYKPDSAAHQGEYTQKILDLKQRATDFARQDPALRDHVADMAGFRRIEGPSGPRFVSFHENVPHKTMEKMVEEGMPMETVGAHAEGLKNKVLDPLRAKGINLGDVVDPDGINAGNIAMVPNAEGGHTPKILDFMPNSAHGEDPLREFASVRPPSAGVGDKTVGDVRREVFSGARGSRQAPKVRIGPAGSSRFTTRAEKVVQGLGGWAAEHPGRTAAIAATPVALGLGAYGLSKALGDGMPKAATVNSFFDEMLKLSKFDEVRG
jgi:hypothetical protein